MAIRILFILYLSIYLLLFLCVFTIPHLNWKEDLFLLALIGLYLIGLASRRLTQGLRNYFLLFILIFLLSHFYINHFQPWHIGWWFASIPGWLTLFLMFIGLLSLVLCEKNRLGHSPIQKPHQTLEELIKKVSPEIILVSLVMFFLFVFNLEEYSAQSKLVPEYSAYMIVGFGFALFYSLNYSFGYSSWRKMRLFLDSVALGVLILLIGLGTAKIYRVYTAYWNALDSREILMESFSRSEEKVWLDVLELNRTPKISFVENNSMNELGKINAEAGNYRQASNYFNQVLARDAFHFDANLGLAEIAYKQNKWKEAQEAYQKAIHLKPKESNLYSSYIHSCTRGGKIAKAVEFIDRMNQPGPLTLEPEDYLIIGGSFLKEKRLQEAFIYLQRARESMPDHFEAYLLLGKAYLESGQYSSGCEALERATQVNPKSAEAYHHLGIGYENMHQDHKAILAYERAVSIDAKNIEGFYHLRRLYQKIGLQKKAKYAETRIAEIATKIIEAAEWKGRSEENIYENGEMYWTGKMSALIFLKEGNAEFIFQAQGTPARGIWPHMIVELDGEFLGQADVTSAEFGEYKFAKRVKPGKYLLNVSFTNDGVVLDKNGSIIEDRNLFVKRCCIVYE